VDLAALVLVGLGLVQGLWRGLAKEVAGLVSVSLSCGLGLSFYQPIGAWLVEHGRLGERAAQATAFITIAAAIGIVFLLLRLLLRLIMQVTFAKGIDRLGGAVAGLVRASLFVLTVFIAANLLPHEYLNRRFGEESFFGRQVLKAMPTLRESVEQVIEEKVN
jgi:uncharacterized membrane protein required for colicin V production